MLKILKYNKKNSVNALEIFLNKRKSLQRSQTSAVNKIIQNVKKNAKNGPSSVLLGCPRFSSVLFLRFFRHFRDFWDTLRQHPSDSNSKLELVAGT